MTEQQSKKGKFKKLKKKYLFIIVSAIIVAVGIFAFVLASGIANGWASVAAWFGSSDAIFLYMIVGLYLVIVAYLLIRERIEKL